jgi:hypothetical protein
LKIDEIENRQSKIINPAGPAALQRPDSGVRSQESEVRSENDEHLLSAFRFLPSDFYLLTPDF